MEFQKEWLNPERTMLLVHLPNTPFTWKDQNQAVLEVSAEIAAVDHTVHLIVNAKGATMPPGNPLPHLRFVVQTLPENTGKVITFGMGRFERTILNAFFRVASKLGLQDSYLVETLDEAHALIANNNAHTR